MCRLVLQYFVLITVLLSLGGCGAVNSMRMMQINSDVEPVFTGDKRIKLQSVFLGEKPYVYANVDGQDLLFLIDTGASFFILMDTPKVKSLGLKRGFDLALGGWGEQEDSVAFQTDIDRIDLGGVYFDHMKAALIPVSKSHYYLRSDEAFYDGVIGHDMLKHFTWEFDANDNAIYLSQDTYQAEENAQHLPFETFLSKISVKGALAFNNEYTADGEFVIDTGSRHYLKLSAVYPKSNEINIASSRVRAADFGLSGMVEHERVILPSLTLGQMRINNLKTNLIPSDDEDDWWVLGNAFLNQFKTVIDYKNEALYLVPQQPFVTDHNLFGLELRKITSGEFVVRYVFPNLPAGDLDIKVGDLVTHIGQQSAQDITLSQYTDIASKAGSYQICIQRDTQCFTLEAKEIDGYSNL